MLVIRQSSNMNYTDSQDYTDKEVSENNIEYWERCINNNIIWEKIRGKMEEIMCIKIKIKNTDSNIDKQILEEKKKLLGCEIAEHLLDLKDPTNTGKKITSEWI